MEVFIVLRICDFEYYCTEVVFVTSSEFIAQQYCKQHSVKDVGWDGKTRDTITYIKKTLQNEM